jgi:hypothetical protein
MLKQNIMAEGTCDRGDYSPHGDQEAETDMEGLGTRYALESGHWRLTPVILATQRMKFKVSLRK